MTDYQAIYDRLMAEVEEIENQREPFRAYVEGILSPVPRVRKQYEKRREGLSLIGPLTLLDPTPAERVAIRAMGKIVDITTRLLGGILCVSLFSFYPVFWL